MDRNIQYGKDNMGYIPPPKNTGSNNQQPSMERYHQQRQVEQDKNNIPLAHPENGYAQNQYDNPSKKFYKRDTNGQSYPENPQHYPPNRGYPEYPIIPQEQSNYSQRQVDPRDYPEYHPDQQKSYPGQREKPINPHEHSAVYPQHIQNHPEYHSEHPKSYPGQREKPMNYHEHSVAYPQHIQSYQEQSTVYREHLGPRINREHPTPNESPVTYQEHSPIRENLINYREQPGRHQVRPESYQDPTFNLEHLSIKDAPVRNPEYSMSNREHPMNREHAPEYSISNRENPMSDKAQPFSYLVHPITNTGPNRKTSVQESLPKSSDIRYSENQVRRSKSFNKLTDPHQDTRMHNNEIRPNPIGRHPSNAREFTRPALPQVEYGSQSHNNDVYAIPHKNNNNENPDHYRAKYKERKQGRPRIPKPDYTWNKKLLPKLQHHDFDESD